MVKVVSFESMYAAVDEIRMSMAITKFTSNYTKNQQLETRASY